MSAVSGIATGACLLAAGASGIRWLRVAQREHYIPGSVLRFAARWWIGTTPNPGLGAGAMSTTIASAWWALPALGTAVAVACGPVGLSMRGRSAPLVWTRRLRTLAAIWALLQLGAAGAGWAAGNAPLGAAAGALAVPFLLDASCAITSPLERLALQRFVRSAASRLRNLNPTVVGITGSYGKTSTKNYVLHLLSGSRSAVASPASFNNSAGLARTVNEHLAPGTEVMVVEMGTYAPGEIAELCSWLRPTIGVITSIGPVHLERFGTEESILRAKAEIAETVDVVVLNIDDLPLAGLADELERQGRRVVRCSALDTSADVCVCASDEGIRLSVRGQSGLRSMAAAIRSRVALTNTACAAAVALELGIPYPVVAARLESLPEVSSRLGLHRSELGFAIIDDTYNSNPAGCRLALGVLRHTGCDGCRRVLVTPGMVELGSRQGLENSRFAAEAAPLVTDIVIVGRTNRAALLEGLASAERQTGASPQVVAVATRPDAVRWVRRHLGDGDMVLYENDLPDHYP